MAPSPRSDARRRARETMLAAKRRERRQSLTIKLSALLGSLAFITVVAVVLVGTASKPVAAPRNMASDGIVLGTGLVAARTPALTADRAPAPTATGSGASPTAIQLYSDFQCPNCKQFEDDNGDYLEDLVKSGAATLEYHPISILDRASAGTKYSTRAANAAVCVANYSPDAYFGVNKALYAAQPEENSAGLSDGQLQSIIGRVKGIAHASQISTCIDDQKFSPWVTEATKRAIEDGAPGTDVKKLTGTPTVLVDGKQFDGSKQTFREFVAAASAH